MKVVGALPDGASPQPIGDVVGFVDVSGEDSRRQSVLSVVGPGDHLLQGFELQDLHHWAKNL